MDPASMLGHDESIRSGNPADHRHFFAPPQSPALFALPFGFMRPLPPPLRHLHQARSIGANRHALGDLGALGRQYAAFGSVMERSHERKTP